MNDGKMMRIWGEAEKIDVVERACQRSVLWHGDEWVATVS